MIKERNELLVKIWASLMCKFQCTEKLGRFGCNLNDTNDTNIIGIENLYLCLFVFWLLCLSTCVSVARVLKSPGALWSYLCSVKCISVKFCAAVQL